MSIFGNLTAGYILEDIEKEIEKLKEDLTKDPEAKYYYLLGLNKAKEIVKNYEY